MHVTSDYLTVHFHRWRELRVTAIARNCDCGAHELVPNHRGRVAGQRRKLGPRPALLARNVEWKRLYEEEGLSGSAIAKRDSANSDTVRSVLRKVGTKMRISRRSTERDAEMVRLRTEEHLSLGDIGARFGVTRERARQILRREGVDGRVAAHERSLATAKKYQPPPPRVCKHCGEEYPGTYAQHKRQMRHWPNSVETDARDVLIAADYAAGVVGREIMAKYRVSATAISRAVRYYGVPLRRPATARLRTMAESRARADLIAADYLAGLHHREIAAEHGVSPALVLLIARNRGIWHGVRRRRREEAS